MQFETETETPPASEFDRLTSQIRQFIQDLQQSPHDDAACHMALKGFCGAIAGIPELLEEMEAEGNTVDLFAHSVTTLMPDTRWMVLMGKRDRLLGRVEQTFLQAWEALEPGSSDYISIPAVQVEELLGAIAALYQEP